MISPAGPSCPCLSSQKPRSWKEILYHLLGMAVTQGQGQPGLKNWLPPSRRYPWLWRELLGPHQQHPRVFWVLPQRSFLVGDGQVMVWCQIHVAGWGWGAISGGRGLSAKIKEEGQVLLCLYFRKPRTGHVLTKKIELAANVSDETTSLLNLWNVSYLVLLLKSA